MTDYLIGTGGWAYFKVPRKSRLRAYSEVFSFVEVNYTFYEYPDLRRVDYWRRSVPKDFNFAVRCHQDLTHKIGLRPSDEAYYVFGRMLQYYDALRAPFLVLETPASYVLDAQSVSDARNFFSSTNLKGVRLVWESRAPMTTEATELMRDFNIVHSVDFSRDEKPAVPSDVVYSRLFGKGRQHNLYEFTDEELVDIDRKILESQAKTVALSYHGVRMNTDAIRFLKYKQSGTFLPVTEYTGLDSAKTVLGEDAAFPASKSELLDSQGWKVIDLTPEKRIHLSELLLQISDRVYANLDDVATALEEVI